MARPKGEATRLYETSSQKMIGLIIKLSILATVLSFFVLFIVSFEGWKERRAEIQQTQQVTTAQTQAVRDEALAAAQTKAREEYARFDKGVWVLKDHTLNTERDVYVDSFSLDSSGRIAKFLLEYSFTGNGKAYSNTWDCRSSQLDRYDCTLKQTYEGGSWRNRGTLIRKSGTLFTGRYLYENQWYDVSLVQQ